MLVTSEPLVSMLEKLEMAGVESVPEANCAGLPETFLKDGHPLARYICARCEIRDDCPFIRRRASKLGRKITVFMKQASTLPTDDFIGGYRRLFPRVKRSASVR